MRKGEIACYKQFLLFSQCFSQLYIFSASKCGIVWSWVNPFPNKPWFLRVCHTSLLKTLWEEEKLLVMSNFSFSHSVFYLLKKNFVPYFHLFGNCFLQTLLVWKSLKFVVWKRVNAFVFWRMFMQSLSIDHFKSCKH